MNNLNSKVVITGYTELSEFEDYISATDVCLNLRYPYNGETSGSLMRILAKGKCSMINDLGSFSEVPDNCCIKLKSPEAMSESIEIDMIYNKFEALITHPQMISEIGNNARRYAEEKLDIRKVVQQYSDYIVTKPSLNLTESMIVTIIDYMKKESNRETEELHKLSATLAYFK
ncbi:glycosyltransferase [Paenibacillus gorillae]|uniref:glycosyltransferase n=1 Tax=Paenibacillus gorillae TaxID=1243662 RepID=UPI0012DF09BB|nr:glycosyltransferase [Paenibacillus gorillae]